MYVENLRNLKSTTSAAVACTSNHGVNTSNHGVNTTNHGVNTAEVR